MADFIPEQFRPDLPTIPYPRGETLIITDQNQVALKVVASEKEHPLITTNPAERIIV